MMIIPLSIGENFHEIYLEATPNQHHFCTNFYHQPCDHNHPGSLGHWGNPLIDGKVSILRVKATKGGGGFCIQVYNSTYTIGRFPIDLP
jgi:hypothetical protein